MPAKLIHLTTSPEDQSFCQRLAQSINFTPIQTVTATHLERLLLEDRHSIVMFDVDHRDISNPKAPLSIQQILPIISRNLPPSRVFALSDKNIFELPHLTRMLSIGHYCVRQDDAFAFEWLSKVIVPLFSQNPCDMSYYIDEGVKPAKIKMDRSLNKNTVLEGITRILTQKNINARCADAMVRSIDELMMNAIFDAPVDAQENHYRRSLERDDDFFLNGREEIEVSIALNAKSVVVCVEDRFGSLSPKDALAALQRDYSVTNYHANAETKSAGLGLHGIAGAGGSLLLNVKQQKLTQAILSFPYFKNYKSLKASFRSFSLNIS